MKIFSSFFFQIFFIACLFNNAFCQLLKGLPRIHGLKVETDGIPTPLGNSPPIKFDFGKVLRGNGRPSNPGLIRRVVDIVGNLDNREIKTLGEVAGKLLSNILKANKGKGGVAKGVKPPASSTKLHGSHDLRQRFFENNPRKKLTKEDFIIPPVVVEDEQSLDYFEDLRFMPRDRNGDPPKSPADHQGRRVIVLSSNKSTQGRKVIYPRSGRIQRAAANAHSRRPEFTSKGLLVPRQRLHSVQLARRPPMAPQKANRQPSGGLIRASRFLGFPNPPLRPHPQEWRPRTRIPTGSFLRSTNQQWANLVEKRQPFRHKVVEKGTKAEIPWLQ